MTTATSFNRRLTSSPRSTSTASDRCRTRGHDEAARRRASERLRADPRKTPLQRGRRAIREPLSGPGQPREAGATGSRAAQQSGNACGSAIDRAILRSLACSAAAELDAAEAGTAGPRARREGDSSVALTAVATDKKTRFVTAERLFSRTNRASCSSPRFARHGLREARRRSPSATIGATCSRSSRPSASRRSAAAWGCCSTSSTTISRPRTSISSSLGCCARFAAPSPSSSTGSALTAQPCDPCRRGTALDSKSSGCRRMPLSSTLRNTCGDIPRPVILPSSFPTMCFILDERSPHDSARQGTTNLFCDRSSRLRNCPWNP
jgi:hypothetical protein